MNWKSRIAKTIDFISPEGREFSFLWAGSDREKSKKLGVFSVPKKIGSVYQDLSSGAVLYPMAVIVDGENHDLEASLFFETFDEVGLWQITHPMHGELKLQMISITEGNQPITNGNNTIITLQMVKPIEDDQLLSSAQIADQIEALIAELNAQAAAQLLDVATQNKPFDIQALKNSLNFAKDTINAGLERISNLNADIARITNEIQRATSFALLQPQLNLLSIATQIQQLAQAPALAIDNVTERLNAFTETSGAFFTQDINQDATSAGKNDAAIKELSLTALGASLPRIVATGTIETRGQAISMAENLATFFDTMTDNLDETQKVFEGSSLEVQYYSQSSSYTTMMLLISLGIKQLIQASFDLKIEKRFILKKNRSPIEITIAEYGSLGENDENFDYFIETNNLQGDEILILPPGKEVVVYV